MKIRKNIVLTVFLLIISILFIARYLAYLAGLLNSKILQVVSLLGFLPVLIICIAIIISQSMDAFGNKSPNNKVASRILLGISVVIFLMSLLQGSNWTKHFTNGLYSRLESLHLEEKYAEFKTIYQKSDDLTVNNAPEFIKDLNPDYIWVDRQNLPEINLGWSGIGAWGIKISFSNSPISESEIVTASGYRRKLNDNMYIYYNEK